MKTKILYAPVLLLSLSMACGKSDKNDKADAAVVRNIETVAELAAANPVANPVVADETAPAGTPETAPVGNAAPVVPPTTEGPLPPEPTAEAPTNAAAPSEEESSAPASTGLAGIDQICSKSFAAIDAKAETIEDLAAAALDATTNTACQKALLSTGSALVTELSALGVAMTIPTGSGNIAFTPVLFTNVLTGQPEFGDLLVDIMLSNVFVNETYFLPDANEKLEYVKLSIADLEAEGEAADPSALMMLNLSLEVQQGTVDKFNNRISKLNSLATITKLASSVGNFALTFAEAAAAPAPTEPALVPQTPETTPTPVPETPATTVTPAPTPAPAS